MLKLLRVEQKKEGKKSRKRKSNDEQLIGAEKEGSMKPKKKIQMRRQ